MQTHKPDSHPPSMFDQAALMSRGRLAAGKGLGADQHAQLVKQTEKWVSQTFYGTLLKQMRNDPFHSDLFDGGNGGKAFEQMFDQRLADHMSHGAGGKLVRAIVHKIEAAQAAKKYGQASRSPAASMSHSRLEGASARQTAKLRRVTIHHVQG